jgi:predicted CoA-binding protein/signal transduction histidine kinase
MTDKAEFLRKVELFASLPDEDLWRLCEMVEEVELAHGQELFAEGSQGDRAYVIESGELEILKNSNTRQLLLSVRGPGDVIGEMALLEQAPRNATVKARGQTRLLAVHQEQFDHLLQVSPTASRILLNTVLARFRSTSAALSQSQKMAQLGTLTAGVAHELNNPAAAVRRGAGQLDQAMADYAQASARLVQIHFTAEQQAILDEMAARARLASEQPAEHLDALARSDREYELDTWLDERRVPDSWELAPALVNLGYDLESLVSFAGKFSADQLSSVIHWLNFTYNVNSLIYEIKQGAFRISEIVKALKSYSYLDQAPVQDVDIHEGLDNTLLILRSKLKNIKVTRAYAALLPSIQAYGSELNQVWTNLIDNAADALQGAAAPEITVRTFHEAGWVRVEVEDNGPGIPAEIQPRIFDAFFTTKPPGKGTGLGLEISYNIVVNKHRGEVKFTSRPGKTTFCVYLPVNFEDTDAVYNAIPMSPEKSDETLRKIFETAKTVAVVGFSSRPEKPAHSVPVYLQQNGYRIIPVNPNLQEILGEKAYPDLLSIPEPVDVVLVFRPSEEVQPVVEQAIQIKARAVWMQEGITNAHAADLARQAGLDVVMDTCMRNTHRRFKDN